jgi:2-oxoglutarate dehydrogenase E2 component (dihydrolipoamide succinyltransferase)
MAIELKIPELGESITEVEIGDWLKQPGEPVQKDDPLVTLESDKATVELPAPDAGTISRVLKQKGDTAKIGEVIAVLEHDGQKEAAPSKPESKSPEAEPKSQESKSPEAKPAAAPPQQAGGQEGKEKPRPTPERKTTEPAASERPRSQRLQEEPRPAEPRDKSPERPPVEKTKPAPAPSPREVAGPSAAGQVERSAMISGRADRQEEIVPMSRLRRTVAERLVEAQRNAALLTTFNEIDMTGVLGLRKEHGEAFQKKYNVKLGFMSFFVKAVVDALKQFNALNAEVRNTDIVYRNYFDIGIAIGSGKGLVVPVLRNAERLSFAEIELAIGDFGRRAQENKLKPEELQGGTFTISNGGVYGSLLSTPIVNPPQSGVLGMHAIQERPVAREGQVVIRPMMYVALTYDHRIVDGREAVSFLKRVKETIENPARMLIEV